MAGAGGGEAVTPQIVDQVIPQGPLSFDITVPADTTKRFLNDTALSGYITVAGRDIAIKSIEMRHQTSAAGGTGVVYVGGNNGAPTYPLYPGEAWGGSAQSLENVSIAGDGSAAHTVHVIVIVASGAF